MKKVVHDVSDIWLRRSCVMHFNHDVGSSFASASASFILQRSVSKRMCVCRAMSREAISWASSRLIISPYSCSYIRMNFRRLSSLISINPVQLPHLPDLGGDVCHHGTTAGPDKVLKSAWRRVG